MKLSEAREQPQRLNQNNVRTDDVASDCVNSRSALRPEGSTPDGASAISQSNHMFGGRREQVAIIRRDKWQHIQSADI